MAHLKIGSGCGAFWPLVLALAACGGAMKSADGPTSPGGSSGTVASNVTFDDYAGTQACASCHAPYVASWLRSPMHNMTREAKSADFKNPFDGTFRLKDDEAKLTHDGAARFVSIDSKRFGKGVWQVTRVIGGHHREDYAGVPVESARAGTKVLGSEELVLPVSYVFAIGALRYKGYSVMVKERDGLRPGPVWRETCIFCHNTVPYLDTVLGAIAQGAHERGVKVRVVLDPTLATAHYSAATPLLNAGIPVSIERGSGLLHHKLAIIDGSTVITGSMNWSRAGDESNSEDLVIIRDKKIAAEYIDHYQKLVDQAHPYERPKGSSK